MMQIIEQTDEDKLEMYMKCDKEQLAKMLIESNKTIDHMSQFSKPYPLDTHTIISSFLDKDFTLRGTMEYDMKNETSKYTPYDSNK
jgi:hypothetical protein